MSEKVWKKDVQAKYRESGPTKTPSENTHISDKTIHGHKYINYSSTEKPNQGRIYVANEYPTFAKTY